MRFLFYKTWVMTSSLLSAINYVLWCITIRTRVVTSKIELLAQVTQLWGWGFLMATRPILAKYPHYIRDISSIRRSRCGKVRPNRFSNTFWASSGVVTQRRRTVFFGWPSLVQAGKTTSPLLILANSSRALKPKSKSGYGFLPCQVFDAKLGG